MNEYRINVISRLGTTHVMAVQAESSNDALKKAFPYIRRWRSLGDSRPSIRVAVHWDTISRNDHHYRYHAWFTCDILQDLAHVYYTEEDIDNALAGLTPIYAVIDHRTSELKDFYDTYDSAFDAAFPSNDVGITWLREKGDKERMFWRK